MWALAPVIPIGRSPYGCCAEAVWQGVITNQVRRSDSPIAPVMNNAGRATPCARAPLTGADLGRQTFTRLQLISRCSTRKIAERTKGENRQEAKHGQILPGPRLITAQRWASSLGTRAAPSKMNAPMGFPPKSLLSVWGCCPRLKNRSGSIGCQALKPIKARPDAPGVDSACEHGPRSVRP